MRLSFFSIFLFLTIAIFSQNDYTKYVNPFIGTGGHGHTYPGAQYPYGMMQLSPDTRIDGWDGCSGYHHTDSIIHGFAHTHLSGTGVSDYSDLLIMPFTEQTNTPYNTIKKLKTSNSFSHKNENAAPGLYNVTLNNNQIAVSLTTTARCGMHKYKYNSKSRNKVLLDLQYRDELTYSKITFENDSTISGIRYSKAWAVNQKFYFVLKTSIPIKDKFIYQNDSLLENAKNAIGTNLKAILFLPNTSSGIDIKVGISATSIEGARKNLDTEIPDWNFDRIAKNAKDEWNKELGRIEYNTINSNDKTIFYTALYHCMIVPTIFSDVDNQYLGRDFKIHKTTNFDYYTVFSLWDTYRAYHPLMSIIDRKRTRDYVLTFLEQFKISGILPIWEFASNETFCMIGNHSIPVITDAIEKNIITDKQTQKELLNAMVVSANVQRAGMDIYKKYGYIPSDKESESVSKTLEYAYDDWCIAQTAKLLHEDDIYNEFIKRSQSYKNLFNPFDGFISPKKNANFTIPFDPKEVTFNYTEANGWQYNFYMPQDVSGYIELLGGQDVFEAKLDSLFTTCSKTTGRDQSDITGLIGQYAHGNEPSHHMAYLYAWTNNPWKTQLYCDSILKHLYFNAPNGLSGNEDCGQMSAWYILSAMGFYPVNPANGVFVLGAPQHSSAIINLENGNKFTIKTENLNSKNKFIKEVFLNGLILTKNYITYLDILKGGELKFVMTNTPTDFGKKSESRPKSSIDDNKIDPLPFASLKNEKVFAKNNKIYLHSTSNKILEYRIKPNQDWQIYKKPLKFKKSATIEFRILGDNRIETTEIIKKNIHYKVQLLQEYNSQYTAGGPSGLVDEQRGVKDFRVGNWQGYSGTDFTAVVDLGKKKNIQELTLGCLQEARSWIWMPKYVDFFYSIDGKTYTKLGTCTHNIPDNELDAYLHDFTLKFAPIQVRFIKVFAKNYGVCPEWHLGKGGNAWIFVDEIIVK